MAQSRIVFLSLSFVFGLAWGLCFTVTPATAASSWVVTSVEDTDGACSPSQCTLRAAIKAANSSAGEDVITFDIPPAGPKTIVVGNGVNGGLPIITGSDVVIDATSQPGGGAHGIRLDDPDVGGGEHGLVLEGNRITIRGFAITRFDGWGILVWGGSSERIQGNWIGTADGVSDQGTGDDGIRLQGGGSSLIGGSGSGEGNLVSGGNNAGIEIRHSNDNVVSGNMVGLTADGLSRLPNASTGIQLSGTSSGNRVGGLLPGERNYASGNDGIGVQLIGNQQADGSCLAPEHNVVQGNYLGLDVNGDRMSPSGNRGEGVALHVCARHNTIGGTTAAARNIISGNAADGVELDSTGGPGGALAVCDNVVQGNYIGLSPSGLVRRDNFDDGVGLDNGACNNLIGGTEPGARNYISGNSNDGVDVAHFGSNGNVVEGNVIGLGVNNATIHNGWYGVMFRSKPQQNILRGNVISGNAQGGIRMQDNLSYYNEVRQNMIGTDITGTEARANRGHGIWLFDGPSENLISQNTIMWNLGAGIAVERVPGSTFSTHKNRITDNRMRGNGGLGIDLLPAAGVNPLDGVNNDTQIGNNGTDAPVISQATANVVRGMAPPNTSVEVYLANLDAGETNGEGSSLINTVTANASGEWCLPQSGLSGTVTATATDAAGNTSEFAANMPVAGDEAACGATAEPGLLLADDFTGPDGSPPANWTVNRSAGGTGAGAAIWDNTLREDVVLASQQDGILQYVQAKANAVQPDWSTTRRDFLWQMQTDATTGQTIGIFLTPQAVTGNASNATDYLRLRVANGQVALLRRSGGGSPITIWSGPVTSGATLRQFELRLDGTNLWLYEGAVGSSSPALRVGPIAHGLTWTSGHFYLHTHNSSYATPYRARFDNVRIYDRGGTDATAPTVSGVSPTEGATDVATSANAEVTFSEAMDPNTISSTNFTLSKQGTNQPLTAQVGYDSTAKKATLNPNADLEAGTAYTATLKGGTNGVKDAAGNPLAMDKVWSFTTAAASSTDTTPPETTIDSGPIGSTNNASASLAFSSNELGSTFECRLDNATYSTCTSPKSYASLVDGSHTFEVRAKDAAGNIDATPASRTWTVDTKAPTPVGLTPADGETEVSNSTNVVVTFSEEMDAATVNGTTFTLSKQGATAPVGATVTYDAANRKALLDPNADLDKGAIYIATVQGGTGGVKDIAGNALVANKVWTFTTALAAPLAAPSNLLATRSGSPSNQRIDLTWADSSSAEAGFVIERSTTSNFTSNLVTYTVGVNAISYRDTALQSNTTYYYRVFAVDSTGKKSAPSNVASVTTK